MTNVNITDLWVGKQKTTPADALAFVTAAKAAAAAATESAAELRKGLDIFGITAPPHADLAQTCVVHARGNLLAQQCLHN